jgi:hypothetical protein
MAEHKSFLSTVPGMVTGIAGLLTGVVGLLSLSFQQGWIGDSSSKSSTTVTTLPGAGTASSSSSGATGSGSGGSAAAPRITVSPTSVALTLVKPKQSVTVTNAGEAAVTMDRASLTGGDNDKFQVDDGCNGRLPASGSCTVEVSLGSGASGSLSTQLLITPEGGTATRVNVSAALL